jgi:hypothetical protein
LKQDGYFGFLTSSSWLDVEYGFALQGWILRHFKLLAVMESNAEPWFTDARVKTVATILQRCDDEEQRMANQVRFVRFDKPLSKIISAPPGGDEAQRQRAVDALRDRILSANSDEEGDGLRIIVKPQRDLWEDGVNAGSILRAVPSDTTETESEAAKTGPANGVERENHLYDQGPRDYVAGKWGRFVRAPDFYFEVMRRFGSRFVALGEIATVRRGITSGCDAFFMPRDVTADLLRTSGTEQNFRHRAGGAKREDVESGLLRIIEAGDGSIHSVEAQYLLPEVHSMMKVERPTVRAKDLDRVVLLVGGAMKDLRGTWVHKYLKYGAEATFASKKSKAVPVPQRSTCAARDPWYDLTKLVRPGFAFWPMAQQYRHIIAGNPERLICNHNLFDLSSNALKKREQQALLAVLNSTLVGLFKTFYGRFAGTEGNLKTEVVDVELLEVPDPRNVKADLAKRMASALKSMSRRTVGRLVEEPLMERLSPDRARRIAAGPPVLSDELRQEDRRELDDAVFELLGVDGAVERMQLVHRLHEATALHFRNIRVVEIEKQQQRARNSSRRFSADELAADAWDAAELPDLTPLAEWLTKRPECTASVNIPDERPAELANSPMFEPNAVYFGRNKRDRRSGSFMDCTSREQAKLVVRVANLGVSGWINVPPGEADSATVLRAIDERISTARKRFQELAESRTSEAQLQSQILEQLTRWFVQGREPRKNVTDAGTVSEEQTT